MCEPTTIAITMAVAGAAIQGKAASDQAGADAAMLGTQAEVERLKGKDAIARGRQLEGAARIEGTRKVAETTTSLVQGNIDVQSGSALNTVAATRMFADLDAATIRSDAAREAWGHEVQAKMYEDAAAAKKKQGALAMAGSFLGGAGNVARLMG
jgi:hypothetical protein